MYMTMINIKPSQACTKFLDGCLKKIMVKTSKPITHKQTSKNAKLEGVNQFCRLRPTTLWVKMLSVHSKLANCRKSCLSFLLCIVSVSFCSLSIEVKADYRIHFGSCLHQDLPAPIFDQILNRQVDRFFFIGDAVYGDDNSTELNRLQDAYLTQKKRLPNGLFSKVDAIWDDHDYGVNDGGSDYPHKHLSKQIFLDFWAVPKHDDRRQRQGIYFNARLGQDNQIEVIFLDVRWFKDLNNQTLLGKAQWHWLEQIFRKQNNDKVQHRILVSPIQVLSQNFQREGWHQFPHERDRLLDEIAKSTIPTLIISGDRHQGAVYKTRHKKQMITEITTSGMNEIMDSTIVHEANRVGEVIIDPHVLELDFLEDGSMHGRFLTANGVSIDINSMAKIQ